MPLQSSCIRSWTAALSMVLLGCDPGIATQVLVTVDADDATRTRAEAIRITVLPKDAEPIERVEPLVGPEARLSFIFTQPLHPRGNDASRSFYVVVEALDGTAEPFVTRTVRGTYADGERREVRILLTENYHDRPACGAERTCVEGACAPVCVETQPDDAPPLPTPPTSCATHRKRLTVPVETARSDQTGFPLLVSLSEDDDLAALATEDGSDIAFIGGNGALLDHELILFQRDTGRLIAWVRVPVLRAAADTTLFVTFGAGVAERRPTAVWSDYELVVHLDEPAPPALEPFMEQMEQLHSRARQPWVVGVSKPGPYAGQMIRRNLRTGAIVPVWNGWAAHVSTRNLANPAIAIFTKAGAAAPAEVADEVIGAYLDGSGIERYAHMHTVLGSYLAEGHACASRDGNKIVFRSNWDVGGGPIDAYVIEIQRASPPLPGMDAGPSPGDLDSGVRSDGGLAVADSGNSAGDGGSATGDGGNAARDDRGRDAARGDGGSRPDRIIGKTGCGCVLAGDRTHSPPATTWLLLGVGFAGRRHWHRRRRTPRPADFARHPAPPLERVRRGCPRSQSNS